MAIPTAKDYALRDIEDLAANVLTRLTTMRHTPGKKDRQGLRETVQAYADKVMDYADSCEQP